MIDLSCVFILLVVILLPNVVDSQSLEDRWNLETPSFNYTSGFFTLIYTFSNMFDETMDSQTFGKLYLYKDPENPDSELNCKQPGVNDNSYTGNSLELFEDSIEDSAYPGNYTIGKQQQIKISMDTFKVPDDDQVFTGRDGEAVIAFCVRYGLYTTDHTDPNGFEVNFIETLVTLKVDLRGEFTVEDISVGPKEKLKKTANQEYGLVAFQCDGKNDAGGIRIPGDTTFRQGDVITICVQPEDTAISDNIYMKQVEKFDYVLLNNDGETKSNVRQPAIDISMIGKSAGDKGEMMGLTEIDHCQGETACVIKTILYASFYKRTGLVSGSGTATMQFGTDGSDEDLSFSGPGRRRLRDSRRSLQANDEDVAGVGEFDLSFQIDRSDDPFIAYRRNSGASSSISILAVAGSFTAALFFI